MSDELRGTDWQPAEVDACVSAYFELLEKQIRGEHFQKTRIYRALSEATGRTPKSIEFKFQNISAVLNEVGFDWINGLAPLGNYQQLLAKTIDHRLADFQRTDIAPNVPNGLSDLASLFIEPAPERESQPRPLPDYMRALIAKFDPVERDKRNTLLGEAGEGLVYEYEKRFLRSIDRNDLAGKVRWVAKDDGDGAGYDILSFDDRGDQRFIEVKTTIGGNRTPFFISRNERRFAQAKSDNYSLVRVFEFRRNPRAFELKGDLEKFVRLTTDTYRADFHA